jgi:CHAT domain-containing protein
MLEGPAATESRVRTALMGKRIIHLATHGIVRDDDPAGSFLALGISAGAAESDGTLTTRDIYELDLDAELVVLSACRSGGATISGDGIAAFARAFIYAGTPSLVASLWDVADEPTNRLLPAFYRDWRTGTTKARSLRRAQLDLLRDLRAGRIRVETTVGPVRVPPDPMFWAAFVLVGEPE